MSMEGSSHLGKALDLRRAKCEPDLPPHSVHPPGPKCPEPLSAKGPSVWKPSLPSLCSPSQLLHCFLRTRVQRTYSLNARGALTRRGLLREPRALSKALRSGRWGKGAPRPQCTPPGSAPCWVKGSAEHRNHCELVPPGPDSALLPLHPSKQLDSHPALLKIDSEQSSILVPTQK